VFAAALLVTAATALSALGPAGVGAQAASPFPPAPSGSLLARLRVVLPTLVLNRAEARQQGFDVQSNTFDNAYPPSLEATFRQPLPGLRDDLFWVRGTLLLQVGGYGPRGIPLLQSRQELVAVRLDARASALP
jgi:hypothetical protein